VQIAVLIVNFQINLRYSVYSLVLKRGWTESQQVTLTRTQTSLDVICL